MERNARSFNAFPAGILSLALALAFAGVLPAQAPPLTISENCCNLIYSTGRWLGWAASLLEYTKDRHAPSPEDQTILRSLREAGRNAEAANRACLQELPAWPDWRQRQAWLDMRIKELQGTACQGKSYKTCRQLVASAIDTSYDMWAGELAVQRMRETSQERNLKGSNCEALYFKLGFDLAYASQAYRQAEEALLNRKRAADALMRSRYLQAAVHQMNRTRFALGRALEVLRGMLALGQPREFPQKCARIDYKAFERQVHGITSRAPSLYDYQADMRTVIEMSDRIGQLLETTCVKVPKQEETETATTGNHGGKGTVFIGKMIRVSPTEKSDGRLENVPFAIVEKIDDHKYRVLKVYNQETAVNPWRYLDKINELTLKVDWVTYQVYGDWMGHSNMKNGSIPYAYWWARIQPNEMTQLRESRHTGLFGRIITKLIPPHLPDGFWKSFPPPHCQPTDRDCSGDITGIWCNFGDIFVEFSPEKRKP